MEYITLKNSDLYVSRLGMGCCPMGGYGWGEINYNDMIASVLVALDNGINFFDNADIYGLGNSEKTLGKAIKGKRDKAVIATKFGVRIESKGTFYDNRPEYINQAIEASLRRLDTDYVDLYQIHYRDKTVNINDVVNTLEKLKDKGCIRYYGLSNIHKDDLPELSTFTGKFVSFQDEYSLACRKNENDLITISKELEITPITWGSLGQGVLTGKYQADSKFDKNDRRSRDAYANFHGEKLKRNLEIVKVMRNISLQTGKPVASIAIRFILDYIKDSVVLTGVKNPKQVISNIEAMDWNLSDKQVSELLTISNSEAAME